MKRYDGSCHCGKVTFEVTGTYDEVLICDCSICVKKGIIHRNSVAYLRNVRLKANAHPGLRKEPLFFERKEIQAGIN